MSGLIQLISAGAGSGKTFTLTRQLRELLAGEVATAGVIATTFTRLAAGELRERVRTALIEAGRPEVANQMEQALIGTVNSVCGSLLERFAFEAGLPPEQQVLDETQADLLFFQAMEQALAGNRRQLREMNAVCHRLQIVDPRRKQQLWRQEVKRVADAARANNLSATDLRSFGPASADSLLAHFPAATDRDLDAELLGALNRAIAGIEAGSDGTKVTRDYLVLARGARAALINHRLTWPEWLSLGKQQPGARSREWAGPVQAVAADYAGHAALHRDIRFFAEQVFGIAAASIEAYQDLKRGKGLIDFVDQEQRLYRLLELPAVQQVLEEELQLLMVDEFQDTSPIQLALFLRLSRLADRVIWVGDIKQSIYGFRGADPDLMTAVINRVVAEGNPPQILGQSWRSTPELVAYANQLFTPAFADTLRPEQVQLESARASFPAAPAVETWQLNGRRKEERARALATGLKELTRSGRQVVDRASKTPRALRYGDIAVLCRTHDHLEEIATALVDTGLPVSYQRPGLLATPEGCLAMACLRRLIDPADTLATAEIVSLTDCGEPEEWIGRRLDYLADVAAVSRDWLEDGDGPVATLAALRERLPYLTPVETLRAALDAAGVRETVFRWGPDPQRARHRLGNLAALLRHAAEYLEQCATRSDPATAAGLALWLQALHEAGQDTQATTAGEDAIQLVTHHGAKGLEWHIVVAMDLASRLKPRLWGLSVLPAPGALDLDHPLADRRLRYWPSFSGNHSSQVPLLDAIADGPEGRSALAREEQEAKRLLYVSLTRARDGLILTREGGTGSGPWMDTLQAPWMLPTGDRLQLPDGTSIPARHRVLEAQDAADDSPPFRPTWTAAACSAGDRLPRRRSPSACPPLADARLGTVVTLGDRLPLNGECDPATLGSALHAVIATRALGQDATARVLEDYGIDRVITPEAANDCADHLFRQLEERFAPRRWHVEYPVSHTDANGQITAGWIDLLLECDGGFVLIDHKASPRSRGEWESIALSYSGQLAAYRAGIECATGRPVLGQWIHFALSGGLVEVTLRDGS